MSVTHIQTWHGNGSHSNMLPCGCTGICLRPEVSSQSCCKLPNPHLSSCCDLLGLCPESAAANTGPTAHAHNGAETTFSGQSWSVMCNSQAACARLCTTRDSPETADYCPIRLWCAPIQAEASSSEAAAASMQVTLEDKRGNLCWEIDH